MTLSLGRDVSEISSMGDVVSVVPQNRDFHLNCCKFFLCGAPPRTPPGSHPGPKKTLFAAVPEHRDPGAWTQPKPEEVELDTGSRLSGITEGIIRHDPMAMASTAGGVVGL